MQWNKVYFETLESTNKTAKAYDIGTVIRAGRQTGGRGRYGNKWVSPAGNLYMSAVVKAYADLTPLMAFVTAVAVAEAFESFDVRLKWPNDVLMNGNKLAGILLERTEDRLIIGIGVNVASHPADNLPYRAADLNGAVSVETAQDMILAKLAENMTLFETQGFAPIRDKWKKYAVGIGSKIAVHLPHEQLTGIFKDFSLSGALLLQLPDNSIKEITAGAVFFI